MLSFEFRRAVCTQVRELTRQEPGGIAMRSTLLISATVLLAGCYNSSPGKYSDTLAFAPTTSVSSQILFPSTLPVIVIPGSPCQTAQEIAVATSFDIVVIPSSPTDVFMDSVTMRLINGETVGGPSITFPTPDLNRMFGPTVVVGRRAFTFRPQFGCQVGRPRSIAVDVVLSDGKGHSQTVTGTAAFGQPQS
jgi:hypothetical protein